MSQENIYEEIISHFKRNELQIEETQISEFDSSIYSDSRLNEPEGIFIPRLKEGYFRSIEETQENKRRYTHELGHGIFCENFELGQRLSQLDQQVFNLEQKIYGEKPQGNFISIPANIERSYIIDQETAEFISGEKFPSGQKYFLVDQDLLNEYLEIRSELNQFYSRNLKLMEGFSIVCESQIVDELKLDKRPDHQVDGYQSLSGLSFQEVIETLN